MRRPTPGGVTSWTDGGSVSAPSWVKLVRQGNTFSGYTSANGTTWQLVGTYTIPMVASIYVGLVVTSHDNAVLCTATVDNVTVSLPPSGPQQPIPPASL